MLILGVVGRCFVGHIILGLDEITPVYFTVIGCVLVKRENEIEDTLPNDVISYICIVSFEMVYLIVTNCKRTVKRQQKNIYAFMVTSTPKLSV